MTGSTGVRHLQRVGGGRSDESKRMRSDVDICNRLLDFWHVAVYAFVASATGSMMRVRLDGRGAGTVRRMRSMTFKTENVCGLQEISVVLGTVNIVAAKAGDAVSIHLASHEIIALHPVLVRGSVGEVRE